MKYLYPTNVGPDPVLTCASVGRLQRLRNAQFLHMELPRRIAQRIVELQQLPNGLAEMTGIQNVIGWWVPPCESPVIIHGPPRKLHRQGWITRHDRTFTPAHSPRVDGTTVVDYCRGVDSVDASSGSRGLLCCGRYAGYVDELLAFTKPTNAEEEHDFTCLLASILCDHTSVPRALAAGTTHSIPARNGTAQRTLSP